jgi:hypothetical protein
LIKGGSFCVTYPPRVICKDITLRRDGDCQVVVNSEQVDDGSGNVEDTGTVDWAVSPTDLWGEWSHLVTLSVSDTNGAIGYCLANVTVVCYRITAVSGNYSNAFSDLSGQIVLSNTTANFLDVGAATNARRFYRVRRVPQAAVRGPAFGSGQAVQLWNESLVDLLFYFSGALPCDQLGNQRVRQQPDAGGR